MTDSLFLFIIHAGNVLIHTLAEACSALSGAILLALLLRHKDGGTLAINQAQAFSALFLRLLPFGPVSTVSTLGVYLAELETMGQTWHMPSLFAPAILPYTSNCLLWFLIWPIARGLKTRILRLAESDVKNKKKPLHPPYIHATILLLLCFLSWVFLLLPFAGLPEGMSPLKALLAILENTEHRFFFSFLPLAVLLLALFPTLPVSMKDGDPERRRLLRWIAGTGLLAGLPRTLSTLGTLAGYLLKNQDMPFRLTLTLLQQGALVGVLVLLGLLMLNGCYRHHTPLRIGAGILFLLSLVPGLFV
ncbi:MAG: hypothetical protein K5657_01815 [Desulfovibrio sp.]|nr:hypothetical protein [Desulfovibrio sp.]